jgi:hypothetical protein
MSKAIFGRFLFAAARFAGETEPSFGGNVIYLSPG